jgi:hypothetical protein
MRRVTCFCEISIGLQLFPLRLSTSKAEKSHTSAKGCWESLWKFIDDDDDDKLYLKNYTLASSTFADFHEGRVNYIINSSKNKNKKNTLKMNIFTIVNLILYHNNYIYIILWEIVSTNSTFKYWQSSRITLIFRGRLFKAGLA